MTTDAHVAAALSELQDFIELRAQHHAAELRRGWAPGGADPRRGLPKTALFASRYGASGAGLRNAFDRQTAAGLGNALNAHAGPYAYGSSPYSGASGSEGYAGLGFLGLGAVAWNL